MKEKPWPAARTSSSRSPAGRRPSSTTAFAPSLIRAASFPNDFGTVYAGFHGIEGVLKEELMDLSAQPAKEIELLRFTPAAGSIGTCRYKLLEKNKEDFDRAIEVLKAHDVGYLFYIGGNDSMDTAHKMSVLAAERGLDLVATGVPKTIDNDVGDSEFKIIDHTPGYGSVARYWACGVLGANEENAGSSPADPVLVMQAMGRKIGFIPAAARLADPERRAAAADLHGRIDSHARAARRERERPAQARRPLHGRRQRRVRRRQVRRAQGLVRPRAVRLERDHRRADRRQLSQPGRPRRPRRGARERRRAPTSGTRWSTPRTPTSRRRTSSAGRRRWSRSTTAAAS